MKDILIFPDFEAGHVFPTFKMAHNLKNSGYNVAYIGIADVMKKVAKEGFETHVVFEDIYPEGHIEKIKQNRLNNAKVEDKHTQSIIEGRLDAIFKQLNPKVLICSCHILVESLALHYRYEFKQMVYWPHFPFNISNKMEEANFLLPNILGELALVDILDCDPDILEEMMMFLMDQGKVFKNMAQIVEPMKQWTHLMTCPKELEINRTVRDDREVFLGPNIRETAKKDKAELAEFLPRVPGQQLIFASMGSQVAVYPKKAMKVFKFLIECMRQPQLKDFHLTLSVGGLGCDEAFNDIPDNMSIHTWIPQVDVLQHSSMAIIHGGLGSVKECIVYDVPMLLMPMGRDQPDNAIRIQHHRLGLGADIDSLTMPQMLDMILKINHDPTYRENVSKMRATFLEEDAKQHEVQLMNRLLGPPANANAAKGLQGLAQR